MHLPDTEPEFDFDPADLDLTALRVVALADSANLPETGASWISAHVGSCSCSYTPPEKD